MQLIFILPLAVLVISCVILALYKIGKLKIVHKPKIIIYKRSVDKKKGAVSLN